MNTETDKFCAIHPELTDYEAQLIRCNGICRGLPLTYFNGKHFCILHLPADYKGDLGQFYEVVQAKLNNGETDFQYIDVPDSKTFFSKHYLNDLNFAHARFRGEADFRSTKFKKGVSFRNAIFESAVYFDLCEFQAACDFEGVVFRGKAGFSSTHFSKGGSFDRSRFEDDCVFSRSTFSNHASFEHVVFLTRSDFASAEFLDTSSFDSGEFKEGANFTLTTFSKQATFFQCRFFNRVNFTPSDFKANVFFNFSRFDDSCIVRFDQTNFFGSVSLQQTDIRGFIYFEGGERIVLVEGAETSEGITDCFKGSDAYLNLSTSRIEEPHKVFFDSVRLEPNWFIKTNSRQFAFTDCSWRYADGEDVSARSELLILQERRIPNASALLQKTCWQLADNYEEAKDFALASLFRSVANEAKRVHGFSGFKDSFLHRIYWLSSYYGENWAQAFTVLAFILLLSAIAFLFVSFEICPASARLGDPGAACEIRTLSIWESLRHSFAVATFQQSNARNPVTSAGELLTTLERICVPLQATLLALAIRRKFMR